MKKHLLSTSAIALGVMVAAPAMAAEWDVKVSGFFRAGAGYADVDTDGTLDTGQDFDGVDVFQAAEIFFKPSITLDNGLTFGATVELEGNTSGDTIDESYLTISGDQLGTIRIGSENSEGYLLSLGTPDVSSIGINSPSISAFVPFSAAFSAGNGFRTALISSFIEVGTAGQNNDAQRISYRTPNFNGFQLGVSYARDGQQDSSSAVDTNVAGTLHDIFDIGIAYNGTFGGVDLGVSGRWGTGDVAGPAGGDADAYGAGINIGFQGFSFGATYSENDNPGEVNDVKGYSFGVGYDAPGPWEFSATTYFGEGDEVSPGVDSEEEYNAYIIAGRRTLGKGVSWSTYVGYAESENAAGDGEVDGTFVGSQINLSF